MSSITQALFEELKPELAQLIREVVESALREGGGPRYPEKVNVDQASEITGYSRNSLYQLHHRGMIPGAIKVGGKLLFDTETLRDWVDNGGRAA